MRASFALAIIDSLGFSKWLLDIGCRIDRIGIARPIQPNKQP